MKTHKDQLEELKEEYKFVSIYALVLSPFALIGILQCIRILVWLGKHYRILNG